jgi:putative membrane protein
MRALTMNARAAIALLLITGIAMLWMRYGGDASGLGGWFTAKMVFVAAIVVAVVIGMTGLRERISPAVLGGALRVALIGVVACSVLTFH